MKSLEQLKEIREKMSGRTGISPDGQSGIRVVVGMATCGIAAGARPVLNTFVEEIAKEDLTDKATVSQTGCIGICQYEPVVEVYEQGKEKITYVKITPDKAKRIVAEHIKGGNVVTEYTIGNSKI